MCQDWGNISLRVTRPCDSRSSVAANITNFSCGMLFLRHIDTALGVTPVSLATFVDPPSKSIIAESDSFSFM